MKRGYFWLIPVVLIAAAVAAAPLISPARGNSLPMQENNDGPVGVAVTPQEVSSSADTWRFAVQLNTHVTPITQDMVAVSSLSNGNGAGEKPTAWEGDPPGGHHRRGALVFRPIEPMPTTVTLHIREVGGIADRTFTWDLKSP